MIFSFHFERATAALVAFASACDVRMRSAVRGICRLYSSCRRMRSSCVFLRKLMSKFYEHRIFCQLFQFLNRVKQVPSAFFPLQLLFLVALLPSAVTSQSPPITAGLIAHYNADSWTGTRWTDVSGSGNHVTEVGGSSISVARPVGAPAYVHGASTAWMRFPVGVLPSAQYTLFYVARYNGATRRRIFQGSDWNFMFGFHGGKAGVAYHGCHSSCGPISEFINDLHGSDWVIGSDRSNSFRSNGVDRTTNRDNQCQAFARLAINTGDIPSETSDFAIQTVLVYNAKLSDADVQRVEAWLSALQPAFTPANLQARARYETPR